MLFKISGGVVGLSIAGVIIVVDIIWYLSYCRRLGKRYFLDCSICGHRIKKKFIFVMNTSHGFFRTYCPSCNRKEYFTAVEAK